MKLQHKALVFEIKDVGKPEDRTLAFIGNSGQTDRYGDIIEVEGWDLKNFKKNSPFLWAHNYNAPPVGTVVKAFKDPQGLICHTYFPTDDEINAAGWPANIPTPETVYRLYKAGFLKAVSVGFQGIEREPILGKADDQGSKPQTGWRFLKQDLYELSAVPVPADPNAVMLAVQKGIISAEQAKAFDPSEYGPCKCKTCGEEFPAGTAHTCSSDLDQRLVKLGLEPGSDILALCVLAESLQAELAQKSSVLKLDLVVSEEQLEKIRAEWEAKYSGLSPKFKAGAVLNAKNKEALTQARDLISQVLAAAEGSSSEGKVATPNQSIYSLALNPGQEPHGGRPAGDSVNLAEILAGTKELHQLTCPSNAG